MENHHQKPISRDLFSFPSTPSPDHQDSDFEFGCVTPGSPTTDPYKSSPADHLFSNGRLMPHSFPTPPLPQQQQLTSISRATSRTSSVSSKDSLMSSRSNSTNSSRSSVSSARTSSSSSDHNSSEKRLLYPKVAAKTPVASKVVMAQLYGSSQRWQHIVPVPGLKRDDSRRSNNGKSVKDEKSISTSKKQVEKGGRKEGGILWRLLRWFVVACRKCHSMEANARIEMLEGDLNV